MKSIETHVRKFLPLNISAISSVACEADFTVTELVTAAACGATATALTTYAYAPVVGLGVRARPASSIPTRAPKPKLLLGLDNYLP